MLSLDNNSRRTYPAWPLLKAGPCVNVQVRFRGERDQLLGPWTSSHLPFSSELDLKGTVREWGPERHCERVGDTQGPKHLG